MQKVLKDGFEALGLPYNDEMKRRFSIYYDFLTERNTVMNLTAISGEDNVARLHFLDCAALAVIFDFKGKSVIDVGSGAGFPGVPLKIAEPSIELTLLDSHQKRITFLSELCDKLDFTEVKLVASRAEEAVCHIGGSFDVAVSRAVARLNVLCELCMPFVHVGGVFISMKGPNYKDELKEAENSISVLGGRLLGVKEYSIPGTDISHTAIIIEKIRKSSDIYPRQFGQIKKKPL